MNKIPSTVDKNPTEKSVYSIEVSGGWSLRTRKQKSHLAYNVVYVALLVYFVVSICYVYVWRESTACETSSSDLLTKLDHLILSNRRLDDRVHFLEHSLHSLQNNSSVDPKSTSVDSSSYLDDTILLRQKRSEGSTISERTRGKKKNRCNRTKTIEVNAVQFTSSNPNLFSIRPLEGVLGPWCEHPDNGRNMELFGVKLVEYNRKLEISRKGMYFIYSQVTYQSRSSANSYSIHVISGLDKTDTPISVCSSIGKYIAEGEVSCYTSVVRLMNVGDVLYLQQIEADRQINFYDTYTYFGVILLNSA